MGTQKNLVLFIGHSATRSGAPILLLQLIREFKKQSDLPFVILLKRGGELLPDYQEAGKTFIWNLASRPEPPHAGARLAFKVRRKIIQKKHQSDIRQKIADVSLVFCNTITNGDLLLALQLQKCPLITYVHELEIAIREATNPVALRQVFSSTDLFLACSNSVKKNLIDQHAIPAERIAVVNASIPMHDHSKKTYAAQIRQWRDQHDIPLDAFVVGVLGGSEWRKGFDLFFPLAKLFDELFPNNKVHFVWKGVTRSDRLDYDYAKTDLKGKVHLIPNGSDAMLTMACLDIYLLLSREDPYPLVMLEAASLAVPIMCFADTGGGPEFIENDSGMSIPYNNLYAMAAGIQELMENKEKRATMGQAALEKVRLRHNQQDAMGQILAQVYRLLPGGSPPVDFNILLENLNGYYNKRPAQKEAYKEEIDYLNHTVSRLPVKDRLLHSVIPYRFTEQFNYSSVEVFTDKSVGMYYVFLDGKKLYYPDGYGTLESVQKSFTYISAEQHEASPHRYLTPDFDVAPGDVVVDLGAAEGNFSLMVVERAKKLIIVEADPMWMNALGKTFERWKEKAVLINKSVGAVDDESTITLSALIASFQPDIVKMDIEGAEWEVLNESQKAISQSRCKLLIATYHRQQDAERISRLLEGLGYLVKFSAGNMLFVYDVLHPPYFRKGLIRSMR